MARSASFGDNVFINCPFDSHYKPIRDAMIFTIHDAGFVTRCALEISDGTQNRLDKIMRMISECKYGIHDISRTEIDPISGLPRFNMPLELGIFLGCKKFGNKAQKSKTGIIADSEPNRYRHFISDIAGQDIQVHHNSPERVISLVRDWLRIESQRRTIPGGEKIKERFVQFQTDLPAICLQLHIQPGELTFVDYRDMAVEWLKTNAL